MAFERAYHTFSLYGMLFKNATILYGKTRMIFLKDKLKSNVL